MYGISAKSPIYLVSQCYWEAIVVDEHTGAFALSSTHNFELPTASKGSVMLIDDYRRQALGLILRSPPILDKIGELYHRCFSVVLEHT